MGKQTAQGTQWETRIVNHLESRGLDAMRRAKAGQKGEADVAAYHTGRSALTLDLQVVAWKRLTPSAGGKRRSAMGEPLVAVLPWDQFCDLVSESDRDVDIMIQAKAAQALSVTVVLKGLRDWWRQHGN